MKKIIFGTIICLLALFVPRAAKADLTAGSAPHALHGVQDIVRSSVTMVA